MPTDVPGSSASHHGVSHDPIGNWAMRNPFRATLVLLALILLLLAVLSRSTTRAPFSSEARFSDPSARGLLIVPASCPSNPHTAGECTPPCVPSFSCSGNGILNSCTGAVTACAAGQVCSGAACQDTFSCADIHQVQNIRTGAITQICTVPTICSSGACVTAPSPGFVPATGFSVGSRISTGGGSTGGSGSFPTSGHLQAIPSLLRAGERTTLYWTVNYVDESTCSVRGGNGDEWLHRSFSGSSGQLSSSITAQTAYSLSCTGFDGSLVNETVTVNIIPVFEEK